jgi:hypothetical protein
MPTTHLDRNCKVVASQGRGSVGDFTLLGAEDRGAPATSPAWLPGPAGIHPRSGDVYKEQEPEVTTPYASNRSSTYNGAA